jgi:quercetin dioxygenase-like cupin family protein
VESGEAPKPLFTEVEIMNQEGKAAKGESLLGQVLNMAGLVDYQKGAVVSREIIKKQTGTVTVFAFDKGQGLSEHTAPFDALVQILDGEAEVTISRKPNKLVTGEMIIMPANAPHSLKALARFKMALIMIRS